MTRSVFTFGQAAPPVRLREAVSILLAARSKRLVRFLDLRAEAMFGGWIAAIGAIGVFKASTAVLPAASLVEWLTLLLPYLLIALAPIAGYRLALGSFPRGVLTAQPTIRLARLGRWRNLDVVSARSLPSFGPAGFMASLLLGLLLNVPVRTMEYLTAVPAVGIDAPEWAQTYYLVMTGDVIAMNFFYMVCFVMALRSVPLFPRMLVFVWLLDILIQLAIAHRFASLSDLPPNLVAPLVALLKGNIAKVLISAFVWLPYVLLSERVNVTYRSRMSASRQEGEQSGNQASAGGIVGKGE